MDKISALMDGELDDRQLGEQLARLKQDGALVDCWQTFHIIGDSMRGERALSPNFSLRVSDRLAAEPTVLAPRRGAVSRVTAYALSAAASVSAIALVGWVAFVSTVPQVELAKGPVPSITAPESAPAIQLANVPSDGKMNDYLIAHQEFSPSTSIQGVAPYIRTVSQEKEK